MAYKYKEKDVICNNCKKEYKYDENRGCPKCGNTTYTWKHLKETLWDGTKEKKARRQ